MFNILVCLCVISTVAAGPSVLRSRDDIQKYKDDLLNSRQGKPRTGNDPRSSPWVSSGKYQGDILLDDDQIESMVEQFASGRNAYSWSGARWPDRVVIYEFAAGHFTTVEQNWILQNMRFIEDYTCIRFRHRNGERNYVLVTGHNDGCYAHVGYWDARGIHTLNLTPGSMPWGCLHANVIIHEWLHIIGFFHMQSTYNRDQYVRINWENVMPGTEIAFDNYDSSIVSNLGLPYEYDSCMHYGPYDFSRNGLPTITALRPLNGVQMGQLQYITWNDFLRVDRLYGCQAWKQAEDYQNQQIKLPSPVDLTDK